LSRASPALGPPYFGSDAAGTANPKILRCRVHARRIDERVRAVLRGAVRPLERRIGAQCGLMNRFREVDEAQRLVPIDLVGTPEFRDRRVGVPRLPRRRRRRMLNTGTQAWRRYSPMSSLHFGSSAKRPSSGAESAPARIVHRQVVPSQVVPRGRVFSVGPRRGPPASGSRSASLNALVRWSANFVFVPFLSASIPLFHQLVARLDPT